MLSCSKKQPKKLLLARTTSALRTSPVTIVLLPLGQVQDAFVQNTYQDLQKTFGNVHLLKREEMPSFAYYKPRGRYRAERLIEWMNKRVSKGEVYVGITMQDISTTKGEYKDWGVMGLGYEPGNACVASNYRLKVKSNFVKVVLHELGHTAGLPHCAGTTCIMQDANGGDPTGNETGFCRVCKTYLTERGWKL